MLYKEEISEEIEKLSNIYTNEINNITLLTKKEQKDLFTAWNNLGNIDARNKLIISNLRLVNKIALYYYKKTFPLQELINVGNTGLIDAVYKFDIDKKTKFSSFAYERIRGKIRRYIKKYSEEIHIPENVIDEKNKIIKKNEKIFKEKGINLNNDNNCNYRIENDIEENKEEKIEYQDLYNIINQLPDNDKYIIIKHFKIKIEKPRIDIREIGNEKKQKKRVKEILKILKSYKKNE